MYKLIQTQPCQDIALAIKLVTYFLRAQKVFQSSLMAKQFNELYT